MTAKVQPETDVDTSNDIEENKDTQTYRCPYCDVTYAEELLTRVHITRADDPQHRHRNGLMPEEEIEVINGEGTVVDTRSRRPEDIDLSEVTLDDFPPEITKKQRHSLVVATRHPEIANRSKLTEMVAERLETGDWDTSPPSHQTVRRALDAFYHPHESTNSVNDPVDETLADLTPIQQSIIIARVMLPEEANTAIADRIGCASSYPGQISTRKEHILTDLRSRVEEVEDIETILEEELSASALAGLIKDGYLSDIPIDVQSLAGEMDVDEASSTGLLATIVEETDPAASDSQWGSPVDHASGMQAVPDDPFSSMSGERKEADDPDNQLSDANSVQSDGISTSEKQSSNIPTPAIVSEIAALRQKVTFFRQTLGPISETDEQMVLLDSFAEQIEQSCEAMLEASDHT